MMCGPGPSAVMPPSPTMPAPCFDAGVSVSAMVVSSPTPVASYAASAQWFHDLEAHYASARSVPHSFRVGVALPDQFRRTDQLIELLEVQHLLTPRRRRAVRMQAGVIAA